jgi:hypothetical protein
MTYIIHIPLHGYMTLTARMLSCANDWLDPEDDEEGLDHWARTDRDIIRGIHRHYAGGWPAFLGNSSYF